MVVLELLHLNIEVIVSEPCDVIRVLVRRPCAQSSDFDLKIIKKVLHEFPVIDHK